MNKLRINIHKIKTLNLGLCLGFLSVGIAEAGRCQNPCCPNYTSFLFKGGFCRACKQVVTQYQASILANIQNPDTQKTCKRLMNEITSLHLEEIPAERFDQILYQVNRVAKYFHIQWHVISEKIWPSNVCERMTEYYKHPDPKNAMRIGNRESIQVDNETFQLILNLTSRLFKLACIGVNDPESNWRNVVHMLSFLVAIDVKFIPLSQSCHVCQSPINPEEVKNAIDNFPDFQIKTLQDEILENAKRLRINISTRELFPCDPFLCSSCLIKHLTWIKTFFENLLERSIDIWDIYHRHYSTIDPSHPLVDLSKKIASLNEEDFITLLQMIDFYGYAKFGSKIELGTRDPNYFPSYKETKDLNSNRISTPIDMLNANDHGKIFMFYTPLRPTIHRGLVTFFHFYEEINQQDFETIVKFVCLALGYPHASIIKNRETIKVQKDAKILLKQEMQERWGELSFLTNP